MDKHLIAYYVGIFIVFATHLLMYLKNPSMRAHSLINLVGAAAIAYYFMWREGYIRV
jgi:hypothetical protein